MTPQDEAHIKALEEENRRLREAMRAIIERSHNDPLGTSKVVDMREIARAALKGAQS